MTKLISLCTNMCLKKNRILFRFYLKSQVKWKLKKAPSLFNVILRNTALIKPLIHCLTLRWGLLIYGHQHLTTFVFLHRLPVPHVFTVISTLGHFTSSHKPQLSPHYRCIPLACPSCLCCTCSAPPCRRADITPLRNLTSQRKIGRMNVWQLAPCAHGLFRN